MFTMTMINSNSVSAGESYAHLLTTSFILIYYLISLTIPSCEMASAHRSKVSHNKTSVKHNCDNALRKCTMRMPCGMALHDYRISCKQELYGLSKSCSELCQLAIISLATTNEGFEYLYCDCADNDYCKLIRRRMQSCDPRAHFKIRADNSQLSPCKSAELYCKNNVECNEALTHYKYMCMEAISGVECSRKCNNSISILWRQKAGVNLRNCSCEKTDVGCVKRTENIMKLCYGLTDFKVGLTNDASTRVTRAGDLCSFVTIVLSLLMAINFETSQRSRSVNKTY